MINEQGEFHVKVIPELDQAALDKLSRQIEQAVQKTRIGGVGGIGAGLPTSVGTVPSSGSGFGPALLAGLIARGGRGGPTTPVPPTRTTPVPPTRREHIQSVLDAVKNDKYAEMAYGLGVNIANPALGARFRDVVRARESKIGVAEKARESKIGVAEKPVQTVISKITPEVIKQWWGPIQAAAKSGDFLGAATKVGGPIAGAIALFSAISAGGQAAGREGFIQRRFGGGGYGDTRSMADWLNGGKHSGFNSFMYGVSQSAPMKAVDFVANFATLGLWDYIGASGTAAEETARRNKERTQNVWNTSRQLASSNYQRRSLKNAPNQLLAQVTDIDNERLSRLWDIREQLNEDKLTGGMTGWGWGEAGMLMNENNALTSEKLRAFQKNLMMRYSSSQGDLSMMAPGYTTAGDMETSAAQQRANELLEQIARNTAERPTFPKWGSG